MASVSIPCIPGSLIRQSGARFPPAARRAGRTRRSIARSWQSWRHRWAVPAVPAKSRKACFISLPTHRAMSREANSSSMAACSQASRREDRNKTTMSLGSIKAAQKVSSLSLWERVGVRGYGLSIELRPLTRRFAPTSPRRGEVNNNAHQVITNSLALVALPQSREHFQATIAVGREQAHLGLIILHRLHGVVADAAVGAARIEACIGEPGLQLLNLSKRQRALGAGEGLDEGRPTEDAVTEMTDRERIAHGGIVAAHRIEIRPEQEAGAARHRRPELCGRVHLREWLAVRTHDACGSPGG